jgi:hypothetical protein
MSTDPMNYDHPSANERTREIPGDLPDDIAYNAFKLEFERATVNNPERKNRS